MPYDTSYNPDNLPRNLLDRDHFVKVARAQIGDKYRFGAEAREGDPDPTAFDSSELVEWAAHEAGIEMPDGSWNQYRFLHESGASVSVDEALQTKGALVFGFSSDPMASSDRPTRAYVGISLGNGKILDVSERSGEVKEMDPGDFYNYGAVIPDFHGLDEPPPPDSPWPDRDPAGDPVGIPGGVGPMPNQPSDQTPGPARSYGPDGRILHQQFPGDEKFPDGMPPASEGPVCYPDEETPEPEPQTPEGPVCYPDDDEGPTSQNESGFSQVPDPTAYPGAQTSDTLALTSAGAGDSPTYSDASSYGSESGYSDGSDYGDPSVDV